MKVNRHRQQGMVLIMAMFIVVLVTTVVVSISWRYQLQTQRNENRWHGTQARAYLEGGEQLAMLMLSEGDQHPQVDTLWEDWAQMTDPLPTDEGWIRGRLEDAQARFDINNLLNFEYDLRPPLQNGQRYPTPPGVLESLNHVRFIRLLQTLELEDGPMQLQEAVELTHAIVDWIDGDNDVIGPGGAEMGEYQGREVPYFCSNKPMVSLSELMVIKQIQERPEIYYKLLPYVVALPRPPGQEMIVYPLNVNTMPDVMFRIFNIDEPMAVPMPLEADSPIVEMMIEARNKTSPQAQSEPGAGGMAGMIGATDPGGFKSREDFLGVLTGGVGEAGGSLKVDGLDVRTNWFLFSAETLVGEQVRRSKTLMFRDPNTKKVAIIRRADANL